MVLSHLLPREGRLVDLAEVILAVVVEWVLEVRERMGLGLGEEVVRGVVEVLGRVLELEYRVVNGGEGRGYQRVHQVGEDEVTEEALEAGEDIEKGKGTMIPFETNLIEETASQYLPKWSVSYRL